MSDRRTMDYPPRYGLDHPTWSAPTCFHYSTAEEARESITRVYGPDAEHIVVRLERETTPAAQHHDTPAPEGGGEA